MGDDAAKLKAALDLMRRLPPSKIDDNLADIVSLSSSVQDDLLATVDQPLQVSTDSSGREFLLCDYNRDGDSFRSPWTNEYVPPMPDGMKPAARLRQMEELANDVFDAYRERYYESGVSSCYVWDVDGSADFAACVLFRKDAQGAELDGGEGRWDAVHAFETNTANGRTEYKLTSTVMFSLGAGATGSMRVAGSLTRQSTREEASADHMGHVVAMGKQLEDMELKIREAVVHVYVGKTREVFNNIRTFEGAAVANERKAVQADLAAALAARNTPPK